MTIMGVDPSTMTGLVVLDGDLVLHASEASFPKLTGYARLSALAEKMMQVYEEHTPSLVVVEEPFVGHAASALTVIEVSIMLRYFLWQVDASFYTVHPTTLKKWVCGTGAAKKEQMMMHVLKRWGYESPTNNVCDAYALARYGQKFPSGSPPKAQKGKAKSKG